MHWRCPPETSDRILDSIALKVQGTTSEEYDIQYTYHYTTRALQISLPVLPCDRVGGAPQLELPNLLNF